MGNNLRNFVGLAIVLLPGAIVPAQEQQSSPGGVEFFEKRIRPLLVESCQECHGGKKQESGLVLTSVGGLQRGGDRGPPIVAGDPDKSLLIQAVRYADDDLKMPPRGKLKGEQIADLVAWVKMGAPAPLENGGAVPAAKPGSEFNLSQRRQHWAYQPIEKPPVPKVQNSEFSTQNAIDAFIRAKLEQNGLTGAPEADRRVLIRRLAFDLTGLPPAPNDLNDLLATARPDWYERYADKLLSSPRYGERWGRHWLDIVRYSETLGFEFDYDLYNAWRYRDYVIRAFNGDLPYDQFVIEHLAGDLVPEPRRHPLDQCNESILATGFFWMTEGKQTPVDIRQEQADRIDNQIDALSKALLGQTVACARCHDHKFDAITTRDYYALVGYLESSRFQQAFIDPPGRSQNLTIEMEGLKAKFSDEPRKELAAEWQRQLSAASQYLLAARNVERLAPEPANKGTERTSRKVEQQDESAVARLRTALEASAREFQVDLERLERWVKALRRDSIQAADHPMHAWHKLASAGNSTAESLKSTLVTRQAAAAKSSQAARQSDDFCQPGFGGWYITGDAFGSQPAQTGEIVLGNRPERPVARLAGGGADSGLTSLRLQGELRSPTFTIDKPYVHLRVAGDRARVNLVIDGYTLIMNPIYGQLTIPLKGESLFWHTMQVDRWVGHRAYLELSDCAIPPHGLNPPPSAARAPNTVGDGYVVLDQIVFSDDAEPPLLPNRLNLASLEQLSVSDNQADDISELAAAYQSLMQGEISRWQRDQTALDQDGVVLVNWLLENGLLDAPAFSDSGAPAQLAARYRELDAALPLPTRAPALADGTGEDEFVFLRGNYRNLGERAVRGPLDMFGDDQELGRARLLPSFQGEGPVGASPSLIADGGSGRLDLAQKFVDPANPLLSRVIVNRLWQHHFGQGIVRTPDDFGRMGQAPSHPELLDWLASELVHRGWSLKTLHRRMVETSTYRQGSGFRVQGSEQPLLNPEPRTLNPQHVDPDNRLLYRMPLRRLEAEAVRDAVLAASGRLNAAMHGPSVLPFLTAYMEGRGRPNSGPLDGEGRRSVYLNARRNFLTPLLLAFDYPVTFTAIGRRTISTIPSQALTLMNDPFVVQQAGIWAERVLAESGASVEQRIDSLYQSAFARSPTADEVKDAIDFLQEQSLLHGVGSEDPRVWTDLCHVLINVKEFIFIE